MDSLAARVRWILEHLRGPDGEPWNGKSLSAAAGLRSAAHVGMIARGEVTKPASETLQAIAHAAGVSHEWLASGRGAPVPVSYANREAAIKRWHHTVSDRAVEYVRRIDLHAEADPSVFYWFQLLVLTDAELDRADQGASPAPAELPGAGDARKRKLGA